MHATPQECAAFFLDRRVQRDRDLNPDVLSVDKLDDIEPVGGCVQKSFYQYITTRSVLEKLGGQEIDSVDAVFYEVYDLSDTHLILMVSAKHNMKPPCLELRRLDNYMCSMEFSPVDGKHDVSSFNIVFCVKLEDVDASIALNTQTLKLIQRLNRMCDKIESIHHPAQ